MAFPKWQDNFVFCFGAYSALTKHPTMMMECFNYQAKKDHPLLCQLQGKRKRKFALKVNNDVNDGTKTINSKIFSP